MTTRSEVLDFLNQFKGCVELGLFHIRDDRPKNIQALIDIGITPAQRRKVLFGLVPEDYVAGPKPDDTNDTREIWESGKLVEDTNVYIKLRIVQDSRKQNSYRAMVWSFHPAEFPMKYPLKGGEK